MVFFHMPGDLRAPESSGVLKNTHIYVQSLNTHITFETVPIHKAMCQMFTVIVYSSSFAHRTQSVAFCSEGDSLTTGRINPACALVHNEVQDEM